MTGAVAPSSLAPAIPMLSSQVVAQARMFVRNPAISVTSMALPLMLFAFFGIPAVHTPYLPGIPLGTYMLASFAAYAVSSIMVFNYGVTIAIDRGQKVDVLMRSAPLPGTIFMAARTITASAFGLLGLAVLGIFAVFAGVRLDPSAWLTLIVAMLVGAIPFIGLGFAVAYLCSPAAAPAVANLLYLFLAFGSGLLVRLDQMPDFLRDIAPFLPTYHYAQLAWGAIGAASEPTLVSLAWLAGYAIVLFGIARFAYLREAARKFA